MRSLILLMLGIVSTMSVAQEKRSLPTVIGASLPLYPRTSQMAHISGVVRLRIATDGSRASSIEVESGQPMLAQAAKNVGTWRFEQHNPTTFEAIFSYKLLRSKCDSECNCEGVEKDSVLLHLPTDIELTAKELIVCGSSAEARH